ncbi:MAG: Asp-tRNA(Asn)/Glu-tRNA(Gln) amidotransferase subunit GatC [Oscillospiraceae bacterium]
MNIDVKHIAKLAMLTIPDNEIDSFAKEMENIVGMCEHLPELQSTDTLLDISDMMELREDIIVPSSPRDEMLSNVPKAVAGCIVVPRTVEE